ncbi:Tn7-like element transposition protein TnsE [Gracilibacillus dipsosauri]|uniref:Tn7-like element transposition protein TnsE n=1 Tax=Gracilibacillus dipsosauri TaxID=178340 RepID=UPI00240A961D
MEQSQEHVLNENNGERSREDANQPVIDIEPTQIAFRQSTIVNRIPKQEQNVNQGDEYISNSGRGGGINQSVVGLDESIFGGKITPIEFRSMEIADTYMNYGLDHFFAMIRYLAGYYKNLSVSVNFVYLPLGRKFSYLPDGRRRICAIVKVVNGIKESFILEVAVPDNRSLSTLIVPSSVSTYSSENHIKGLLNKLVLNSGSWSNSFLKNQVHHKVRHSNETARNWAQRIRYYL